MRHFDFVLTEPSPAECRKKSDVVFVIDSTSNLQEKDFRQYILGTISEIIQHLDVDWGTTRVAAVHFTNTAMVRLTATHCVISRELLKFVGKIARSE